MSLPALLTALLLAATPPAPKPLPSSTAPPKPPQHEPVILFLIDNSASLPPLDPEEQRVQALEKLFTFIQGRVYRLVLFGGRSEIYVDDVSHYNNKGQWTDFYSAFVRVRDLMAEYPPGTEFRIIMVTDGLIDPNPKEWVDTPPPEGQDLRTFSKEKLLELVAELKTPLYVIMVGDVTSDAVDTGAGEQAPPLVLEMARAANGRAASPRAQRLSKFFQDDGVLVKKFIFRVQPQEGLKKAVPVVQRIIKAPDPSVELKLLSAIAIPLLLFLALLLGIVVRSFPGPGDIEIIELTEGLPLHLAVDRVRKTKEGLSTTGLSLLADARDATGTITWQRPSVDLSGVGLATEGLDALTQQLLPLSLNDLRRRLESLSDTGTKDEKIYALNLDYMAKNFDAAQAQRLLVAPLSERRRVPVMDFLRAKTHLLSNDELRRTLTEPRGQYVGYGRDADRKELEPGARVRIGRYRFVVKDLATGGRKDVRIVLYYDHVPSLLGLKNWLPGFFQRAFRLRRSQQRVVS
jgi:hypothetical protein